MLLVTNGRVLTMDGDLTYERGYVVTEGRQIVEVGSTDELRRPESDFTEIIDANGGYILPGLIDAHCHVGLVEEGMPPDLLDINELTDPVTPHLRAIDAVNPADSSLRAAAEAGITVAVTGPGSANVIGGTFCAIKTVGKKVDDMVVKETVAMKVAFGENPKRVHGRKGRSPLTRMATAAILRETLAKAVRYMEKKESSEEGKEPDYDMRLEALIPVLRREIPLKAHAHRADDIFTALRLAKEFNVNLTIDHCTEGHLIADYLRDEGVPVIIGPTLTYASKLETRYKTFETPGILAGEGLVVAIVTDHPVIPLEYLPMCGAMAVREGMDVDEALRAITINAARNCGLGETLGSLTPGKDGDIAVFNSHPFEYMTKANTVIVSGEVVYRAG